MFMITLFELEKLIGEYKKNYVPSNGCISLNGCSPNRKNVTQTCKTLEDCVRKGICHHNKRMSKTTKSNTINKMKCSAMLKQMFRDFEDLFDYVDCCIRGKGVGQLTVYDISVSLGRNLMSPPIEPKVFVYLHRGALEGAKKIKHLFNPQVKLKEGRFPITVFPKKLQRLGSFHIENFLCVMKDKL